jgi:hypothetical protein
LEREYLLAAQQEELLKTLLSPTHQTLLVSALTTKLLLNPKHLKNQGKSTLNLQSIQAA